MAGRTLVVDIEAKKKLAEMFVFSYGVVVFWNFTEHQEKDILADLTFAESSEEGGRGISLVTRPLDQRDYETEEFHFEYNAEARRPRVFNDMITLLPHSDHMTKLTISHAIAQSTKLCLFEEQMSVTLLNAQHVPKRLALTGELNMTRTEIVRILGRLFRSRVDINLCKQPSVPLSCPRSPIPGGSALRPPASLRSSSTNRCADCSGSLEHPRRPKLLLGL